MSNHNAPCDIPKPASVDEFLVKNGKKKKVPRSAPSMHSGHFPSPEACVRAMWLMRLVCSRSPSCRASSARKGGAWTRSCSRGGTSSSVSARSCVRAGGCSRQVRVRALAGGWIYCRCMVSRCFPQIWRAKAATGWTSWRRPPLSARASQVTPVASPIMRARILIQ